MGIEGTVRSNQGLDNWSKKDVQRQNENGITELTNIFNTSLHEREDLLLSTCKKIESIKDPEQKYDVYGQNTIEYSSTHKKHYVRIYFNIKDIKNGRNHTRSGSGEARFKAAKHIAKQLKLNENSVKVYKAPRKMEKQYTGQFYVLLPLPELKRAQE